MVKRYYIQHYPENIRGNTETRTTETKIIALDFIRSSIESSLTKRQKKAHIRHDVMRTGGFLQVVNLNRFRK